MCVMARKVTCVQCISVIPGYDLIDLHGYTIYMYMYR